MQEEQKLDELVGNGIKNLIGTREKDTSTEYDGMTEGINNESFERPKTYFPRKKIDIASWVKKGRLEKGYTLQQLSEKTNGQISCSYLSRLENSQRENPGFDALLIIGEALELKIGDLIGESSPKDSTIQNEIERVTKKMVLLGNSIDIITGKIPEKTVNEMLIVECLGSLRDFQRVQQNQLNNFVNDLETEI